MAIGNWQPQLKSGTPWDQCVSGLQKCIRRGLEREALVLATELFQSGYHAFVGRRLMICCAEDIGLANPALVAQVHTICSAYLQVKKESKRPVEPLGLIFCIILMCRSHKNRECDDAQIVILEKINTGEYSAARVIRENEAFICDKHTGAGKKRIKEQAAREGKSASQLGLEEFLTIGAQLHPLVEIEGNPWGRECRELFGLDYERYVEGCESAFDSDSETQ